jgi:hypothetical protein
MVVRIRFGKGPKVAGSRRKNRQTALAVAAFLPPAAFMACILALWSIAADLNWSGSFAFTSGILSHWHVWLGAAVALQLCARALNRYGKRGDPANAAAASAATPASTRASGRP